MARFFKRAGSDVVERMSEERTGKPNVWWSNEQLAAHGFREATNMEQKAEYARLGQEAEREKLIAEKTKDLAVAALKAEGKLDETGKIKKEK